MALTSIISAEKSSISAANVIENFSPKISVVEPSINIKNESVENVDTVTLNNKIQKNKSDLITEKNVSEKTKNDDLTRSISDVLFDYNSKGDLRIKFMDSGNKLIYQTPPVLFSRIADLISQSKSSVDTKV